MSSKATPLPLNRDPTRPGACTPTVDPAAQVVQLAAKLIRLQSHLKGGTAGSGGAPGGVAVTVTAGSRQPNARQAAARSGIEVLQGFAVSLIGEIRDAIERDAFHYVYQPIVSATTGIVDSYEALVRWRRGEETVTPALFLPIAEETRSIVSLQQRLLDDVAAAYARLSAPVSICINWSPAQLSDSGAVSAFIDRIRELQIDPARIVIEITERSAMIDQELAQACILRLKETGFRIALDDFGSGYCGFSYLCRLPIDLIKLDGSLISELGRSERTVTVLDGIIDVAHKLGSQVVAERVETAQQLIALRRLGCDLIQGHVVGHPVRHPSAGPAEQLLLIELL